MRHLLNAFPDMRQWLGSNICQTKVMFSTGFTFMCVTHGSLTYKVRFSDGPRRPAIVPSLGPGPRGPNAVSGVVTLQC